MRSGRVPKTRVRAALLLVAAITGSLALGSGRAHVASGADPAAEGRWSAPQSIGVVGVHATLLRNGKVLLFFWGHDGNGTRDGTGSRAKLWNPANGRVTDVSVPYAHNLFCSGHVVLPSGKVFVAGGNKYGTAVFDGSDQTSLFDPTTRAWAAGPRMDYARWYPTTTSLRDGKVLVFSGWEQNEADPVDVIERFDPGSNALDRVPSSAWIDMRLYPRTILLPDGNVVKAGPESGTQILNTKTWQWSFVDKMAYGSRYSGASVLLPGLERVLALGGLRPGTNHATDTAEILDLSEPSPQWRGIDPMHQPRLYMNPVLLPDGDVLVVGGGYDQPFTGPEKTAEVFDPETETWTELAAQQASRIYHSTALLLPDGRVLSAGQNDGPMQTTIEVFSPPYLFRGPRPTISSAPGTLGYSQNFAVQTPDAADIARVALIRPGSVTHSVNFDQRYVDLSFTAGGGGLTVSSPAQSAIAPPGWYMLFLVSDNGVPSVASWVKVR
jgi:hypothetical protein